MPDRWIRDHIGDEVTPRQGFEDELAAALRSAWHAVPATAQDVALGASAPRSPRRRWALVAAIGTAAALLAALTAIAVTRDGSAPLPADPSPTTPAPVSTVPPSSVTPSTGAAPTTGAPPSTAPTATTGSPGTPTTASGTPTSAPTASTVPTALVPLDAPEGFFPACAARDGEPAGDSVDASPSFGRLQAAPALTVHLPASVDPADYPASQRITSPRASATPIPGGLLVALGQANGGVGSLLAAINTDGSVRWVRCTGADQLVGVHMVVGANDPGAEAFVNVYSASGDGEPGSTWVQLDLRSGELGPSLADRLAERNTWLDGTPPLQIVGRSWTHLLVASAEALDDPDDVLLLVDRTTLVAERLPDAGAGADNVQFPSMDDAGRPVLTVNTPTSRVDVGVYEDGRWIADVASVAAPATRHDFDPETGGGALRLVDAAGETRWRRDDLVTWGGEGFGSAVAGEVTIARVCADAPGCERWDVVGLRTADGGEIWRLEAPADGGAWGVGPIADGSMLLQEPVTFSADGTASGGAWVMADVGTGTPLAGQRWDDPATFEAQCCGGGDFVHVTRIGGTVIAVNERRIAVWFPEGTALEPATAVLP